VEQAMGIFADMVARGCERNVITYSSLISAAEKAGRTDLALQLFERMHQEGCRPNVVTYNSLIAACSHGEGSRGRGAGMRWWVIVAACMLGCCTRSDRMWPLPCRPHAATATEADPI